MSSKKDYKQTQIGKIPEDWEVLTLGDIGDIKDGDWILKKYYDENGEVRLLQVGDIGIGKFLDKSRRFISKKVAEKLKVTYVKPEKHILISRMPDPIGRACIAPKLPYPYIVAVDITMLEINEEVADRRFIIWFLNSILNFRQVQQLSSGATRNRVSRKNLEKIKIPLPPLPEQKKIAEILSTVDKAIQKVDEAIAKTERLKKGLMQELLTKGIGHKEFKDTEIGRIPKEWEVVRLGDVVEIYDSKRIPLSNQERAKRKGPYPYCGATGIIDYIDDYIFDGEYVLLAEDGGYYGPFEPSAYIMSGKFWVNNHAHIFRAMTGISNNWFLMYVLNYMDLKPYIVGSTRTKLNQEYMRKITIILPPIPEQQKIAEILSTIDKKLEFERKRKEKLERIKKGLMNDLLTGRKRVKV